VRNTALSKANLTAQTVKSPSALTIPRFGALPADNLSAAIISFARFFFLPLKPQLLADIRQQAMQNFSADKTFNDAKARQALSLAAAAAESKSVELHPKSLESYARDIDPEWEAHQNSGRDSHSDSEHKRRNKKNNEQTEFLKTEAITAESLKKMAFKNLENNQLLEILNRLPGKNGQRWIVLPFDFTENDKKYYVSMRILLDQTHHAACMALDINIKNNLQKTDDTEQRWLFVIYNQPKTLNIYLHTELPKKAHLQLIKDLSAVLKIPSERIFIKCSAEHFPHEAGYMESHPSIDEAV
jgi:hypothetical protein